MSTKVIPLVLLLVIIPEISHAYLDPSSGSLLWQVLTVIGGVGILASFRVLNKFFVHPIQKFYRYLFGKKTKETT